MSWLAALSKLAGSSWGGQAASNIAPVIAAAAAKAGYNYAMRSKKKRYMRQSPKMTMKRKAAGRKKYPLSAKKRARVAQRKTFKKRWATEQPKRCIPDTYDSQLKYKIINAGSVNCAINQRQQNDIEVATPTIIESGMTQMRTLDPATSSLVLVNATTSSANREFAVRYSFLVEVRNNRSVPARVRLIWHTPKQVTGVSPMTTVSNGFADLYNFGGPQITNPSMAYTESQEYNVYWRASEQKYKVLQPGESMTMKVSSPWFCYNPAVVDTHTLAYNPKYCSSVLTIAVSGVIGHSSATATQVGHMAAGIDYVTYTSLKYRYDAGVELRDVTVADNRPALTTPLVNIPDNEFNQYATA